MNSMDESEQKCLVTEVKNVWSRNGCYCVWSRHGAGHEKRFASELKQRLSCNFIQKWNATIRDNDGCFPHRSVKSVSEPEQHLTVLVELDCANYDLVCFQLTTIFIATVSVLETEIVCFSCKCARRWRTLTVHLSLACWDSNETS